MKTSVRIKLCNRHLGLYLPPRSRGTQTSVRMLCISALDISGIHLRPRSRQARARQSSCSAALHLTSLASTYYLEVARHERVSPHALHSTSRASTYHLEVARHERQSACSAALHSTSQGSTHHLEVARHERQSACSAALHLTSRGSTHYLEVARHERVSPHALHSTCQASTYRL